MADKEDKNCKILPPSGEFRKGEKPNFKERNDVKPAEDWLDKDHNFDDGIVEEIIGEAIEEATEEN